MEYQTPTKSTTRRVVSDNRVQNQAPVQTVRQGTTTRLVSTNNYQSPQQYQTLNTTVTLPRTSSHRVLSSPTTTYPAGYTQEGRVVSTTRGEPVVVSVRRIEQ